MRSSHGRTDPVGPHVHGVVMGSVLMVFVVVVVLAVMRGTAEQAHAAKAADPHLLTSLGGGGLSGRFGLTHAGTELGEEPAHDRGTLAVLPGGTDREHVDDVKLKKGIPR